VPQVRCDNVAGVYPEARTAIPRGGGGPDFEGISCVYPIVR
jgi:hypothetical protein